MQQITAETKMGEILAAYPAAKVGLFQKYHIGGCKACGYELDETLEQVRAKHNVQATIDEMIEAVRASEKVESALHVTAAELADMLANGIEVRLLDTRTPEEFAAGHLAGAQLVTPALSFEVLDEWPKDTAVVCYSNDGARSLERASHFRAYGMRNVRSLTGGLDAWTGPLVTG